MKTINFILALLLIALATCSRFKNRQLVITIPGSGNLSNVTMNNMTGNRNAGMRNVSLPTMNENVPLLPPKSQFIGILLEVPNQFWLDPSVILEGRAVELPMAQPFTDYSDWIAFRNNEGYFLGCDRDGKVIISSDKIANVQDLWNPELIGGNIFSLRSWFGGYLGVQDDGTLNCIERRMIPKTVFQLISSSGMCPQDQPHFIILKHLDTGKYFSSKDRDFNLSQNLDRSNLLHGYYDNLNTSCGNTTSSS